jgi:hypothetical protein
MYLKKVVKLPILGAKITPIPHEKKEIVRMKYLEMRREQIRQVSNLYRRMENMKVRLEHSCKNDAYAYK